MRREDLFEAIGMVTESQLAVCEKHRNPSVVTHREDSKMKNGKYSANTKRKGMPKIWLIAAIIAAMVFLMGCAVVYVLSLQEMAFGSKVQEYYDGSTEEVTLLSLQGIQGTPGYQATKEWYDWLETYDTDGAVWDSHEAYGVDYGEEYFAYSIYSQEMKEKLDEICAKYDLELLGRWYMDPDLEAGCAALQIDSVYRPGAQVDADFENILYYANGSFDLEGFVQLPGCGRHIASFTCHRKDAFTELYGEVGTEGTYEEWTYTTSYGVDVLIVIDRGGVRNHAFMMADAEMYTYYFGIYEFEDMPLPDKEELEAYAEIFDFAVQPQRVSNEDLQAVEDRREDADKALKYENYYRGFRVDMTTQTWYPPEGYSDSFESYIPYILEYAPAEYHYYTLVDLDGDGTDELLWGTQDGYIYEVAVMVDGEVSLRFDDYLCEGNILFCELSHDEYAPGGAEYLEGNFCTSYQYNTLSELIVKLYDLPDTDQWVEVRPGQEDRFISEAEAKQIMAQYPIIKLEMKALSEYPLGA